MHIDILLRSSFKDGCSIRIITSQLYVYDHLVYSCNLKFEIEERKEYVDMFENSRSYVHYLSLFVALDPLRLSAL